jgi:hypothetical protein
MKQGNSEFDLLALHDMTMGSVEIPSNLGHCKSELTLPCCSSLHIGFRFPYETFFAHVLLGLQQLWFACAGSGITIPQVGDLVFYFPQGHLEQVACLQIIFS